jgi:hypothetical protein
MSHRVFAAVFLGVLAFQCLAQPQAPAEPIDEQRAKEIALKAAGCGAKKDCVVQGGFREGKWMFIVSFVHSRDEKGAPRFMPGGHMGITVGPDGKVLQRMPGA